MRWYVEVALRSLYRRSDPIDDGAQLVRIFVTKDRRELFRFADPIAYTEELGFNWRFAQAHLRQMMQCLIQSDQDVRQRPPAEKRIGSPHEIVPEPVRTTDRCGFYHARGWLAPFRTAARPRTRFIKTRTAVGEIVEVLLVPERLRRIQIPMMFAHQPGEDREHADRKRDEKPHQDRPVALSDIASESENEAGKAVNQHDEQRNDPKWTLRKLDGCAIELRGHVWWFTVARLAA